MAHALGPCLLAVRYGVLSKRFGQQFVQSMTDVMTHFLKMVRVSCARLSSRTAQCSSERVVVCSIAQLKGSEPQEREVGLNSLRLVYEGTGGPMKTDAST